MALPLPRKTKSPESNLDYTQDWTAWLRETADSDEIDSVEWIVPPGIAKTNQSFTNTTATVWLSGGTLGKVYPITGIITTGLGRIETSSFELLIQGK